MATITEIKTIKQILYDLQKIEKTQLYAILDGALIPGLIKILKEFKEPESYLSLYINSEYSNMNEIAPYLIHLKTDDAFFSWWLDNGWNKHWGILFTSKSKLPTLAKKFRKFLTITDNNNHRVLFRFYDPRVFKPFIEKCSDHNYLDFEKNIQRYCVVDRNKDFKIIPRRNLNYKEISLL